jgi:transcription-repair coupling factor (superfamily II helicase)
MFASTFDPTQPGRTTIAGAPSGHDARVLAEIAVRSHGKPVIYVALDDIRAALMSDALAFFAPHCEVISFPAWDCLPYDRISPHADIVSARITALSRMQKPFKQTAIILTTINAIVQKVLPIDVLSHVDMNVAIGDTLPVEKLRAFLSANGYISSSTVREAGEFAVRGGIIDLFPSGMEEPIRLDFFGDDIESIRTFDPISQTTTSKIDCFALHPVTEVIPDERTVSHFRTKYRDLFGVVAGGDPLYEAVTEGRKFPGLEHWLGLFYPQLNTMFDYVPQSPIVFDYQSDEAIKSRLQQIDDFYQARQSLYQATKRAKKKDDSAAVVYKPAPVASLYLDLGGLNKVLQVCAVATLSPFAMPVAKGIIEATGQRGRDFADARAKQQDGDLYAALRAFVVEQQSINRRVAIACYSQGSAERLSGLLKTHEMSAVTAAASWDDLRKCDPKLIGLIILGLEHGFIAPDLAVVTEQDILGDRLVRPQRHHRTAKKFQLDLGELNPGDFVVHAEHGIGRFDGLETIHILNTSHDCVKLIYDGGDKLFVPVENMDVLTRYGAAESGASLDKLGGVGWQTRKSRVKKRLKDMAEVLIKIAAARELRQGEVITVSEGTYEEFAARFPYVETEDQARAIESVLEDLASGKPMDRLVCGDVGFGKTEVALRAAFAAVQAGLQVAVVVPTTLLARQHFNNFTRRFSGFAVRIAQLSRMVTNTEAKQTKEDLKEGRVDIVVGTHALLGKEVGFKNIGLMIIDEEQHFGVKQKERLKEMRSEVHVLTLTATPIPRTLQLAMSGVRELSLIATPPVDRLAVRTFVMPYDPLVIREAIMREHYRGGQCYYVCPRIEDLDVVTAQLRELVPEIKMQVAHGRIGAQQLDDIMVAFDAKQFDVLLATNIVESGLDIPNANTIILHRADMFGLAQLYQLRGRVGRAKLRGYAYLTYAPNVALSQTAQQRLEVIQTLDQLGAGFQLASHDMDIRGAGNLLGEEQSGQIREVGVELYQQMLSDAVTAARLGGAEAAQSDERWMPQINLGMSVLIPEVYVTDLNVRLGLYRRLAEVAEQDQIEAIAVEMIDRFGPLPIEVENLLQTVAVKQMCRRAGIDKIDAGPKGAVISFRKDQFAYPDRLIYWITQQGGTVKVRPDQKLVMVRAWDDAAQRLVGIKKTLTELVALAA